MPITVGFALFVAVVLVLHNVTSGRVQNLILLVASYTIYAYLDLRFVWLLALATIVTFNVSQRIAAQRAANPIRARHWFILGLIVNIGVLVLFKLSGFFVPALVTRLGLTNSTSTLDVLMPLGISFYSFRLMSYLFDTNNKRLDPTTVSWLDFSLYIAFFPQITSGPIERAPRFLPPLKETRRLDGERLLFGLTYIFIGLYYKIAIADPLVDTINAAYNAGAAVLPNDALRAIILFSIQLYADFAGYSAIAIGISKLFGLPAMENFRQPYFAQSIIEFWTRWHISLSTWFRDYLFYPLSRTLLKHLGSRWTLAVQIVCYLVTMLVTGLWHGVNWTFVVWGLLFGCYMSFETILARLRTPSPEILPAQRWINVIINILITQVAVAIAWVFFRAVTVNDGIVVIRQAFSIVGNPGLSWWVSILSP